MRKIFIPFLLSLAVSLPTFAEIKIATADLMRAVTEVEEGAKAKTELEKEYKAKQSVLDKKQEELKKLKEDFDKQKKLMKAEAKQEKEMELQMKFAEAQKMYMEMQQDMQKREQELLGNIMHKMSTILDTLGKKEGYDLILNKSEANVLYAKSAHDLTSEVIRKYNEAYGKKAKG